jgi:di/tricarboxylate transporter
MGWVNEVLGFDSMQGKEIFLFFTMFGLAVGLTKSPVYRVLGALSSGG